MDGEVGQRVGGRWPRVLRPLRHPDYRYLVVSLAGSLFASGSWVVAGAWWVIDTGGGPGRLSLTATAYGLGLVASALFGGLAADRLPRRALLRGVELLRIAVAGTAGALAVTGELRIGQLAVAAGLLGAAEAFYYPAYSALLPSLLPTEELLAANGLEGVLRPVADQAAGPAAAGILVTAFHPGAAFLGSAAGYTVALLALLLLRAPTAHPGPPPEPAPDGGGATGTARAQAIDKGRTSLVRDLREGFAYMFRTGWFFATLAFASIYVLVVVGPFMVLLPFAVHATGAGPSGQAWVLGGWGAGTVLGSLTTASRPLPRRYLTLMLLAWGFGTLPLAVIGWTTQLWPMVTAAVIGGIADGTGTVIWGTLLQRRVPPHLLGRVSSLDFFVSLALLPVSMALAAPLATTLGLRPTFTLVGAVPPLLALTALLAWRLPHDEHTHPLEHPHPPPKPSEATT